MVSSSNFLNSSSRVFDKKSLRINEVMPSDLLSAKAKGNADMLSKGDDAECGVLNEEVDGTEMAVSFVIVTMSYFKP